MAQPISPYQSLKLQIPFVLIVIFSILIGTAFYTLESVKSRQHDYAILNLAGQLRVITSAIINRSHNYLVNAPRDYESYYRDVKLFNKDIEADFHSYDEIIKSLLDRQINTPMIQIGNPVSCTWDEKSVSQLDHTALSWTNFKQGYYQALGDDPKEPRLEAGAEYVAENESLLTTISLELSESFRLMMQDKLDSVYIAVKVTLVFSVFAILALLIMMYLRIIKPVDRAVDGIKNIAGGDIGGQIERMPGNELGILGGAINEMSNRLNAIFNLTSHVNQASDLDHALKSIFEDFSAISPLDWLGLYRISSNEQAIKLDRVYSSCSVKLSQDSHYRSSEQYLHSALVNNEPVIVNDLPKETNLDQDSLLASLKEQGIGSVLLLPLRSKSEGNNIIAFASTEPNAYTEDQLKQINFIAEQLSDSFEKTLIMENLVVSAVEGLAKLAESRDPETGDHLLRMSIYSQIIARNLMHEGPYQEQIDQSYIRDIKTFAPMHDIGKVGIEDSILLKPGRLDVQEREEMEKHPVIGANVLRRCEEQMNAVGHSIFQLGIEIAEGHHEKFDGSGYPQGLKGQEIPLSARIVAAADVFDALTSKRPYKEAWSVEKALALFAEEEGKHFDPDIIAAMKRSLPEMLEVYEQHKHV